VAKDSKKLNIATFLRWYEPDQVQRDQENLSQPVAPLVDFLLIYV